MPISKMNAFFIRYPVENQRILISDKLNDYFNPEEAAVIELGMQAAHFDSASPLLAPETGERLIASLNTFNESCRRLGIPVIHAGVNWRPDGKDLVQAGFSKIQAFNDLTIYPVLTMEKGTKAAEFATEVKAGDYRLTAVKRYNAFEATDLEFLLKVLNKKVIVLTGLGCDCFGLGTGFAGICKDYRAFLAEDLFPAKDPELEEGAKRVFSLFIGLVVESGSLLEEWHLQKAAKAGKGGKANA